MRKCGLLSIKDFQKNAHHDVRRQSQARRILEYPRGLAAHQSYLPANGFQMLDTLTGFPKVCNPSLASIKDLSSLGLRRR